MRYEIMSAVLKVLKLVCHTWLKRAGQMSARHTFASVPGFYTILLSTVVLPCQQPLSKNYVSSCLHFTICEAHPCIFNMMHPVWLTLTSSLKSWWWGDPQETKLEIGMEKNAWIPNDEKPMVMSPIIDQADLLFTRSEQGNSIEFNTFLGTPVILYFCTIPPEVQLRYIQWHLRWNVQVLSIVSKLGSFERKNEGWRQVLMATLVFP